MKNLIEKIKYLDANIARCLIDYITYWYLLLKNP